MTSSGEIFPGAVPARGTIRPGGVLSAQRGANAGLAIVPDGRRVLSAWCGADSTVDEWLINPLRPLGSRPLEVELPDTGASVDHMLMPPGVDAARAGWPAHILPVVDLAVAEDGSVVAAAAGRGVRLFRFGGDGLLAPGGALRAHENAVVRTALTRTGDRALSTESSGRVLVWSVGERRPLLDQRITRAPHSAAFIWNDLLAAVGDDIGRVVCWELGEGRRHLQFQAHRGPVTRLRFCRETGLLLTAGADNVARLWNLESGRQVGADMPHAGALHDAIFVHEGRFVMTAGADGHIGVWGGANGKMVDWCFEGVPIYRLAYHGSSGLVLYSGPRSIRAAEVDWTGLKAAEDGGAPLPSSPSAFSAPPARPAVTYAGAAHQEAPIGSVLAARQTGDLPIPDRSNLAIARDQGPASPAFPIAGPPRPFGTQALAAVGGHNSYGARPATQALSAFSAPPPSGAIPVQAPVGATGAFGAAPATGASFFGARPSATDPGAVAAVGRAPMATAANQRAADPYASADDFFAGTFDNAGAGAAIDEPAAVTGSIRMPMPRAERGSGAVAPSAEPYGDEAPDVPRSEGRAIPVVAPPEAPPNHILLGGLLLALVAGIAARSGTERYYTVDAYPATVAALARSHEATRDQAVAAADSAYDAFEAERVARMNEIVRGGTLAQSELERLRANVERQVATAARTRDDARADAQSDFEEAIEALSGPRTEAAAKLANTYGGIVAGVVFLLAIIAHNVRYRRREPAPSKSPARGPRSPRRS